MKNFEDLPKEIRDNVDLVIISLPVPHVTQAVLDCIQFGAKGIIIGSGNVGLNDKEVGWVSYFKYVSLTDGDWIELLRGNNYLKYEADSNIEALNVIFYHSNNYLEVQE